MNNLELNKIHHGDCLELMKQIPDKSIDLVLTDPPYGIGEAKGKNKSRGLLAVSKDYGVDSRDDQIPSKEYFNEMIRISKHCIIFGGNYFIEYLSNSPCWIVWDKDNGETDFADCELARTNFNTAVRKIKWKRQGMLQEDMGNKEVRHHPTQKPLPLFRWILENYSEPGMTICDPFLGSGTTAIACKELGRNFIGIEKEQKYVDIANKRLATTSVGLFN